MIASVSKELGYLLQGAPVTGMLGRQVLTYSLFRSASFTPTNQFIRPPFLELYYANFPSMLPTTNGRTDTPFV
jgi:hypothetical protein